MGQQAPQIADYSHQEHLQSPRIQAQAPLPVANFNQQTQFSDPMTGVNAQQQQQQPQQQFQYAQATTPAQQWAQSPVTPMQQ